MKNYFNSPSLSILTGLLFLSACSTEWMRQSSGKINIAMQWPQATNFSIHTIPENTSQIKIRVRGIGLGQAIERLLKRESGNLQRVEFILPTGLKDVSVQALTDDGQVLAEAQESVQIQANQTSKLEMNMKPLPLPEPSPSPSIKPNSSSGGSGGSSNGNTRPPTNGEQPSPDNSSKPLDPNASALPSAPPLMSPPPLSPPPGGGGGADPLDLIAVPQQISGLGYPTEMVLLIPPDRLVGLSVENFVWSCQDTSVLNLPCNNNFVTFAAQPNRVIWTSPSIASGPYRMSVDFLPPGRNTPIHREVMINVLSGTGSLGGSTQIGFDGAVEGF